MNLTCCMSAQCTASAARLTDEEEGLVPRIVRDWYNYCNMWMEKPAYACTPTCTQKAVILSNVHCNACTIRPALWPAVDLICGIATVDEMHKTESSHSVMID